MIKAKDVNTSNVSSEQIGRCHKVFSGSIPFYLVESETDNLTEYKVTWDREHGFAHCEDSICKHVRWSVAAAREEKAAVAELHKLIAEQAVKPVAPVVTNVDAATLARVQAACEAPAKVSKARANSPRGFSLLR